MQHKLEKEYNCAKINVTNKEILAPTGFAECWFYDERVDDKRKMDSLISLFCEHIITGMEVGEVCVFFIKGRDYVKLLMMKYPCSLIMVIGQGESN